MAYSVSLGLDVSVVDFRVFDASVGRVSWSLSVRLAGVDISNQLVGEVSIEAAEDSARVASLSLIVDSPAQLDALEKSPISIDVTMISGGYSASRRRFTGVVHKVEEYSAATRIASLSCRDDYQARIKAAGSALAVQQLFGGLATVSDRVMVWDDADPDPVAYFNAVLATVPGAVFVDGDGQWRVVRWNIGAPSIAYDEAVMFDPGPVLTSPARTEIPSSITATLTHSFQRLHNAEVRLLWTAFSQYQLFWRGVPNLAVATLTSALASAGAWVVKGAPKIGTIPGGWYPISPPGGGSPVPVSDGGPSVAKSLDVTMYRRWYQDVTRRYTVTVALDGAAPVDESISHRISSDFDAAQWESGQDSASSLGLFSAHPPLGFEEPTELEGYAALDAPWPPANGAIDHFADLSSADVEQAVRCVVAESARLAASGRRERVVSFDRSVDLRIDLGVTASVDAYGVSGSGQLQRFVETFDIDAGGCVGTYAFAMPSGDGDVTGFSATVTVPVPTVSHAFAPITLGNFFGADVNTPDTLTNSDTLIGFLCNTAAGNTFYDDTAPQYITQFRIILPEISATVRDPLEETVAVSADIQIAGDGVEIVF